MIGNLDLALLGLAALLAGFVDAVVGGGGLIQVPALFSALPEYSPATLFGTNKLASISGTANAAWRYARGIRLPWALALPTAVAAFGFSFLGAASVAWLPKEFVRPLVFGMLLLVIIHTAVRKDFGRVAGVRLSGALERRRGLLAGAALGFYDGFFGPGAGSFMIFVFIRYFGLDFLGATSVAKVVNLATNAAALAYFVPSGNVLWLVGGVMAVCNIIGAQLGARTALKHGSGFIRQVFLVVASLLALKFGVDIFT